MIKWIQCQILATFYIRRNSAVITSMLTLGKPYVYGRYGMLCGVTDYEGDRKNKIAMGSRKVFNENKARPRLSH